MKQSLTLAEISSRVIDYRRNKKDYIAHAGALRMTIGDENVIGPALSISGQSQFGIRDRAHQQIANWLGIPMTYYRRMLADAPELLTENVNQWLDDSSNTRMVRTLNGDARAVLSNRYRALDNADLLESLIPVLTKSSAVVRSCDVDPDRLFVKAVVPSLTFEPRRGDAIACGVMIRNNETGGSRLAVHLFMERLVCTNGAIADDVFSRMHLGRKMNDDDGTPTEFLSDATRRLEDAAVFAAARDVIEHAFSDSSSFVSVAETARAATKREIDRPIPSVVDVTGDRVGLLEGETQSVLSYLAEGGDLTQYGLGNAITRVAQDVQSYDRATELEAAGFKVWEMTDASWRDVMSDAGDLAATALA